MKEKKIDVCQFSLIAGEVSLALGFYSFILFVFACFARDPGFQDVFRILFFIMIGITAVTAIASIVLGIIGIKQKSENKREAKTGIILSSALLVVSVWFYLAVFLRPSNMNFIFYIF